MWINWVGVIGSFLILIGIMWAFIFDKEFRDSLLADAANNNQNETTIFGVIKMKGAIIITILGLFVALALVFGKRAYEAENKIQVHSSERWVPFNPSTLKPTKVTVSTGYDSRILGDTQNNFYKRLEIDEELRILNSNREPALGWVDEKNLYHFGYFDSLSYESREAITFTIDTDSQKVAVKTKSGNYDQLPYWVEIIFLTGNTYFRVKNETESTKNSTLNRGERDVFVQRAGNKLYMYRNVASNLQAGDGKENFAKFEILQFNLY